MAVAIVKIGDCLAAAVDQSGRAGGAAEGKNLFNRADGDATPAVVGNVQDVAGFEWHVRRLPLHNALQLDRNLRFRASGAFLAIDVSLLGSEWHKSFRHRKHL